jgi:hypothetical protein
MKVGVKLSSAACALFLASTAAVAEIPLPSPVPARLAGPASSLQRRHDALVSQHDRLDREIDQQNADCRGLSPDDQARVNACLQSRHVILGEMDTYQKDLDDYERELKNIPAPAEIAGTSEHIDALCRNLDGELDRLGRANLRIVGIEMDALGKLTVRVPVAVLIGGAYEASEPPEDVLDEAREALLRVAKVSEQIDELNGKRAWSDQERRWVLNHVYVATPTGNYNVSTSDRTAYGQTAFEDLRRMPAFQGCATGRAGKKYIPQIKRAVTLAP